MPSKRKAIVFVVDRLGAGMLGPYGNTWLETPNLNQLASRSLLFEFAQSDSTSLESVYHSYWTGRHAITFTGHPQPKGMSLPELVARVGVQSSLVTDDQGLGEFAVSQRFADRLVLASPQPASSARDIADSTLAQITAGAISQIERLSPGQLIWVHATGLQGPWDAPLELRNSMADEDDPEPPSFVDPPCRLLPADVDPDELLGVIQACAGQVALLDICLGALLDAVDEQADAETLFILTSPRGFPLGEHGRIGAWDQSLYNESLAIPLLVRTASEDLAGVRNHFLAQPADVFDTLLGWFGVPLNEASRFGADLIDLAQIGAAHSRDRACSVAEGEVALRTPAWFLRQTDRDAELYVKPDDRWEMNNVVQRCPQVAEAMQDALRDFERAAKSGDMRQLNPVGELLLETQ